MADTASRMAVRLVGGPTALIEIGGLRLLTDPVFDRSGSDAGNNKTRSPAPAVDEVGRIDVVLLSHDRPGGDLGPCGKALLERAPLILTTPDGAARLGRCARPLPPWYHLSLACSEQRMVRITGVPAQCRSDSATQLTGFVLSGVGIPTSYVSAANASPDVVREIARRFAPIDIAVLLGGSADTSRVDSVVNLTGAQAASAVAILGAPIVIPAYVEGCDHGQESVEDINTALCRRGLGDRLCVLAAGETITF